MTLALHDKRGAWSLQALSRPHLAVRIKLCERAPCDSAATADNDECTNGAAAISGRCGTASVCINTPGSYKCECRPGFVGDGKLCTSKWVWTT